MSIERRSNSDVAAATPREDEHDTWTISYIDLLLLMVTLFILLLSYQQQTIKQAAVEQEKSRLVSAKKPPINRAFLDQVYMSHLKDRVGVKESKDSIKLAISDSILFFPADAALSRSGEQVLEELAVMLKQRPWYILVEGHTDNQSISTPRY
jgi:chemotaxis protein MotB